MDKVRTVLPETGTKPPLLMNVIKVVEESGPIRMAEIEAELNTLERKAAGLKREFRRLKRIYEAAMEPDEVDANV